MPRLISSHLFIAVSMFCIQGMQLVIAEPEVPSKSLTIGVVPQQAAAKLAAMWLPLTRYLEKETGIKVVFRTASDIPTFEQRLIDGEYDFSYMNPYHYTVFHDRIGYTAVAKARDKKLKGILVVHKDSSIDSLDELDGQMLAFPSPAAFAATIVTRAELVNNGIDFSSKYVSSHDSVYRAVAAGLYPAGGGIIRTFNSVDESIRNQIKIMWTSTGSTPHAIAHHPRVDKQVVNAITAALISLERTDDGISILKGLNVKGFIRANDSDYDDVRSLNINKSVGLDS